jgi:hypothetical protein
MHKKAPIHYILWKNKWNKDTQFEHSLTISTSRLLCFVLSYTDFLIDFNHRLMAALDLWPMCLSKGLILTATYTEQYQSIGWFKSAAVTTYGQIYHETLDPQHIVSLLINHLRTFVSTMWNHWNEIMRGATTDDSAWLILLTLHNKIHHHYQMFQEDPQYILSRRHHLFTHHTLD